MGNLCKKRLISVPIGRSETVFFKVVFPLEWEIVDLVVSEDRRGFSLLIKKGGGK